VRGGVAQPDLPRQRAVVDAFLAASRGGDFDALLALLDPDVVVRADPAAVATGATDRMRGSSAAAATFSGRRRPRNRRSWTARSSPSSSSPTSTTSR
jgi:RNA polymerase sigma-70 factor, ECF subfamily